MSSSYLPFNPTSSEQLRNSQLWGKAASSAQTCYSCGVRLKVTNLVPGVMGFVYFLYLALNKDSGSKSDGNSSPGSTDEAMEEAKRTMDT